ncbi:hypothetical protein [Streptomyces mexicanus]|uniref:hypothetical protein n=1 Tax=Streptomyces mexicanus TaxID=178566 RepID=UPI0036524B2F
MPEQKPSVGRIVHYVSHASRNGEYSPQCRAAIVTEVADDDRFVGLAVFNPTGIFFRPLSEGGCQHIEQKFGVVDGGTWHWPERV